jgi:transposase
MPHLVVKDHETIQDLREKLKKASDEAYKTKLKAVLLAKKGKKRFEIVEQLTVDAKSVTTWLARYNKNGTQALVPLPSNFIHTAQATSFVPSLE